MNKGYRPNGRVREGPRSARNFRGASPRAPAAVRPPRAPLPSSLSADELLEGVLDALGVHALDRYCGLLAGAKPRPHLCLRSLALPHQKWETIILGLEVFVMQTHKVPKALAALAVLTKVEPEFPQVLRYQGPPRGHHESRSTRPIPMPSTLSRTYGPRSLSGQRAGIVPSPPRPRLALLATAVGRLSCLRLRASRGSSSEISVFFFPESSRFF